MKLDKRTRMVIGGLFAVVVAYQVFGQDAAPGVHSSIAPHPPKDCGSGYWDIHYGDAYKTLREAEEYKPGERLFYVRELNDHRNEYLLAGISPSFRKDWLTSHQTPDSEMHCIVPLFDEINAAAKRTLPTFKPSSYKQHESSEESLVKDAVKERVPDAEILETGIKQTTWDIEKLNTGLPKDRYKFGMAWIKSPKFDDGYCRIAHVSIYQE